MCHPWQQIWCPPKGHRHRGELAARKPRGATAVYVISPWATSSDAAQSAFFCKAKRVKKCLYAKGQPHPHNHKQSLIRKWVPPATPHPLHPRALAFLPRATVSSQGSSEFKINWLNVCKVLRTVPSPWWALLCWLLAVAAAITLQVLLHHYGSLTPTGVVITSLRVTGSRRCCYYITKGHWQPQALWHLLLLWVSSLVCALSLGWQAELWGDQVQAEKQLHPSCAVLKVLFIPLEASDSPKPLDLGATSSFQSQILVMPKLGGQTTPYQKSLTACGKPIYLLDATWHISNFKNRSIVKCFCFANFKIALRVTSHSQGCWQFGVGHDWVFGVSLDLKVFEKIGREEVRLREWESAGGLLVHRMEAEGGASPELRGTHVLSRENSAPWEQLTYHQKCPWT